MAETLTLVELAAVVGASPVHHDAILDLPAGLLTDGQIERLRAFEDAILPIIRDVSGKLGFDVQITRSFNRPDSVRNRYSPGMVAYDIALPRQGQPAGINGETPSAKIVYDTGKIIDDLHGADKIKELIANGDRSFKAAYGEHLLTTAVDFVIDGEVSGLSINDLHLWRNDIDPTGLEKRRTVTCDLGPFSSRTLERVVAGAILAAAHFDQPGN